MSSDVLTKRVTGTGSLAVGPARVRQIQVLTGAGAGRLTVTHTQLTSLTMVFVVLQTCMCLQRRTSPP